MKSLFAARSRPPASFEAAQADWQQAQAEAERARLRLANLAPGGASETGSQRYLLRAPLGRRGRRPQHQPGDGSPPRRHRSRSSWSPT